MRTFVAGQCSNDNIFSLMDPTSFTETEFELEVIKALSCFYPDYLCGVFTGSFVHEGRRHVSDLALLHKKLTHWFVIEVELAGHSLDRHILPQVRCFRYGDIEDSSVRSFSRAFPQIDEAQAKRILCFVPRFVVVVANIANLLWTTSLAALEVQHLTVSVFTNRQGILAHGIEGKLKPPFESLGFARYSAIDNCLRIPKACGIMLGEIEITDHYGNSGIWCVRDSGSTLWISKVNGPALINHEAYVQILRHIDGKISLRPS